MLAAAALAALALPVHALAEESLAASGSITYTWQGDPAHGCAAVGVCAVQGELIVEPQSGVPSGGDDRHPAVRVKPPYAWRVPSGDCVDSGGPLSGDLFVVGPHPGSRGRIEPALSSGRCAGPLEQDFARLTLPVTRLPGKHPSFDLRTTQGFTAGPFSGTMVRPSGCGVPRTAAGARRAFRAARAGAFRSTGSSSSRSPCATASPACPEPWTPPSRASPIRFVRRSTRAGPTAASSCRWAAFT